MLPVVRLRAKLNLHATSQSKVKEFMVDLKGVMEDIFEQEREGTLPSTEKATCQKLLLVISVKKKMFSEEQRKTALKLLARLEGDRRRKCRVSEGGTISMRGDDDGAAPFIREELRIVSSKKKRRGKRGTPRKSKGGDSDMDEDGARSPRRSDSIDGDGFKVSLVDSVCVKSRANHRHSQLSFPISATL